MPEYRRHGYIKEACKAVIDAFKEGKILKPVKTDREDIFQTKPFDPIMILGSCQLENTGSRRVMESLGFVYDGIFYEKRFCYNGEPMRAHYYHLLIGTTDGK